MNIQTFSTEKEWLEASVNWVRENLSIGIQEHQITSLAVSGGNTPFPIYEALAQQVIQWDKVNLIQVDERYVPENTDDSNWKSIQKSFQTIKPHNIIRFQYRDTIEQSLIELEQQLPTQLGVTILGMGLDGHFASLFAGGEYWDNIPNNKALITDAPDNYITQERLSLSPEYIFNSESIIVLLKGEDKYNYLINSLNQNYTLKEFPLQYIVGHPNLVIYCYLD
jgi:6-phosphogluconolactonase